MEKLAIEGGPKAVKVKLPPGFPGGNDISVEEEELVLKALRRRYLFRYYTRELGGFDSLVEEFEKELEEFFGVKHAHAVTSGTEALKCALIAHEVGSRRDGSLHPEDEVIIPVYTFVSTAFAVAAVGAKPVIADINETLTIDPEDIERRITPNTRAIIPVHMRGLPCDMDAVMDIAQRHGIPVIEDVAQALGASYKGRKLGTFGTGAFSLQFFKNVTSGEGGFVLTDDDLIYERVQMAGDTSLCWRPGGPAGRFVPPRYEGEIFAVPGMGDYRMSELTGAVALANFRKLKGRLEREKRNINLMMKALEDLEIDFIPLNDPEGSLGIALIFLCPDPETTDKVVRALRAEGARASHIYHPDIPDWHVGFFWNPVFKVNPEEYRAKDILRRAVHIDVMPQDTEEICMMQAEAIRKVAMAYLR